MGNKFIATNFRLKFSALINSFHFVLQFTYLIFYKIRVIKCKWKLGAQFSVGAGTILRTSRVARVFTVH